MSGERTGWVRSFRLTVMTRQQNHGIPTSKFFLKNITVLLACNTTFYSTTTTTTTTTKNKSCLFSFMTDFFLYFCVQRHGKTPYHDSSVGEREMERDKKNEEENKNMIIGLHCINQHNHSIVWFFIRSQKKKSFLFF